MLTPSFELAQNADFVIITIHAPYAKIAETEVYFHEEDFKFYSKPYFLRLNLPGHVVENGAEKATYDSDKGTFVLHAPKMTPGEWFEGLDLITKLLAPRKRVVACSPIEVLGTAEISPDEDFEDNFDWEIEQSPYLPQQHFQIESYKYGFAKQHSGVFSRIEEELNEVVDVRIPDKKTVQQRREERIQAEDEQFSDDHYLGDLFEEIDIKQLIAYHAPWTSLAKRLIETPDLSGDDLVTFTEEEKDKMRKLPSKEYLIDHLTRHQLLFSLVDILFAYAYNVRTTEGENTVESVWTMRKLSATLSWLEVHPSLEAAVVSGVRRSLCYPLYRHWGLATMVIGDVQQILTLGKKYVLKCFLTIHGLMNKSDPHYILNDLYITDYCVWVQSVKSKTFQSLREAIEKLKITKEIVKLDLVELEMGAELAIREQFSDDSGSDSSTSSSSASSSGADQDKLCNSIRNMAIGDTGEVSSRLQQANANAEDSSETDTSDESTDSDDFSSSTDDYSSDSDEESTDNSADTSLLRKEKCPERKR